jgi:hypothetical protein
MKVRLKRVAVSCLNAPPIYFVIRLCCGRPSKYGVLAKGRFRALAFCPPCRVRSIPARDRVHPTQLERTAKEMVLCEFLSQFRLRFRQRFVRRCDLHPYSIKLVLEPFHCTCRIESRLATSGAF